MKKYCLGMGSLLIVLITAGCGHKTAPSGGDGETKDAPRPVVQVVLVTRDTLERTVQVTGILQALPGEEATVSPSVAGVLETLSVHYGQTVTRGQMVAQLSTRQLQGQIQQAQAAVGQSEVQVQQAEANALQQEAQTRTAILQAQAAVNNAQATLAGAQATLTGDQAALSNAKQNLTRANALYADGLIPQKDVEAAQATVDAQKQAVAGQRQTVAGQRQALAAARAGSLQDIVKRKDIQVARQQVRNAQGALNTARAQMALLTLRAPLSGQVTIVGASAGESVDTTTKLVTVTNLDQLQLQLAVSAESASGVRPGQKVTFTVDSLPGRSFQTVLVRTASQVDPATGTVPAFAVVANPGHKLRDDTTIGARVVTERRVNVLTVPQAAVLTDPDTGKPSVVVVGTDEVAHVTTVTLGLSANGRVQVLSGLQIGQKVAASGQYGLPDGTTVTVQPASIAGGAAHGA